MADSAVLSVKHPHQAGLVAFAQGSKTSQYIKMEFDDVPLDSSQAASLNVQRLKVASAQVKVEEDWLEHMISTTSSLDTDYSLIDLKCEVLKSETEVSEKCLSVTCFIDKMEEVPGNSGRAKILDCEPNIDLKRNKKAGGKLRKVKEKAKKIFECDQCGLCFGRKDQFIVHTYIHTGEKPYGCSVCEKRFSRADCLTVHMRIHSGQRPFKCEQCDKTFATSGYRREHMFIHAGIKPYACSYCDRRFTHSNDLTKHQRVHTGERPYPCSKCGMTFRRLETLQKHAQRKHYRLAQNELSCTVLKSKGDLEKHLDFTVKRNQADESSLA